MTYHLPATRHKLITIVGPTSSGKSELAVKLAKRFNGEIISADSRQVYKGMDLGTGKIPGKWHKLKRNGRFKTQYRYKGILHHIIDFVSPKRQYSAALFQRDAQKIIANVTARGKLPVICGGTGHFIDALVYNQTIPDVKPNLKLRAKLEKKTSDDLYLKLKKLDPARAKNIDPKNKRRLIRALEIITATGKPIPKLNTKRLALSPYNSLLIGLKVDQKELYKKIEKRLKQRLDDGMIKEVKKLRRNGLSWKRLESFGLEYRYISLYLQKKLAYDEMLTQLSFAIKHYSKRQMTWWKRNKDIKWIKPDIKIATLLASKFLNQKS